MALPALSVSWRRAARVMTAAPMTLVLNTVRHCSAVVSRQLTEVGDAGRVHESVETAECIDGLAHGGVAGPGSRHVADQQRRNDIGILGHRFGKKLGAAAGECDVGALTSEMHGDSAAYTARGANDNDLALADLRHHGSFTGCRTGAASKTNVTTSYEELHNRR